MGSAAVLFLLVALVGGRGSPVSMVELASFDSQASCQAALHGVEAGLGSGRSSTALSCVSAAALERLHQ